VSTDDAADYQRAKDWLKVLHDQILRLRLDERVWEEVQGMIKANPDLHRPSQFYRWMRDMYVSGMAMAIRRLADHDSRSISFYRFLKLLKGNPSLVSRKRYRNLFPGNDPLIERLAELGLSAKEHIDHEYDGVIGEGKQQPTREDIQAELDALERLTSRFVTFADKVIAHHDETKPDDLPRFSEVDKALKFFEGLVQKYTLLFHATSTSMTVAFQYDWKAIFRVPWMRSP
jgi:hypothetical protein